MINELLNILIKKNGSDLYISSGSDIHIRVNGDLVAIPNRKFNAKDVNLILEEIMTEVQLKAFKKNLECDFSMNKGEEYRFRVNVFNNLNGPAAVFRSIPFNSMTLKEIGTPPAVENLCKLSRGLVLVTGPTGSGKSTTLAAMINMINDNYQKHIITIEDPVEFRFKNSKCLINQREVGVHTKSFSNALRGCLRESPDVIMVGEMRDAETVKLALTAAETGHLVISTLHTMSASQTINRIIDTFPGSDKEVCRSMLSVSLQGIVSQRLIKSKDGGRCAALEIILANTSVRNLIREDKIPQINSIIEIGQRQGMVTMKKSLINLVEDGKITKEKAREVLQSFGQ